MNPIESVGDWIDIAPWRDRKVSLLLLDGPVVTQADTLGDKRALLAETDAFGPTVLVLWTGKWRTEARRATPDDVSRIAELLA